MYKFKRKRICNNVFKVMSRYNNCLMERKVYVIFKHAPKRIKIDYISFNKPNRINFKNFKTLNYHITKRVALLLNPYKIETIYEDQDEQEVAWRMGVHFINTPSRVTRSLDDITHYLF